MGMKLCSLYRQRSAGNGKSANWISHCFMKVAKISVTRKHSITVSTYGAHAYRTVSELWVCNLRRTERFRFTCGSKTDLDTSRNSWIHPYFFLLSHLSLPQQLASHRIGSEWHFLCVPVELRRLASRRGHRRGCLWSGPLLFLRM